MAGEPRTIAVEPGGELDRLLDEAAERPLRLMRNGERFRLDRDDDIWAGYDPEKTRESTLAFSGSWRHLDADALKAYVRERRKTQNRPPVRW